MPKTITIDSVALRRVQVVQASGGSVELFAEYQLESGGKPIQAFAKRITTEASGQLPAAQALFQAVAQQIAASEIGS